MPRIATVEGEDVRDPTEDIKEELLAGAIVGLGETFKATHLQWAEGIFKTFEAIMSPAEYEDKLEAREHLIKLLQETP
jgi:hypothetical protein